MTTTPDAQTALDATMTAAARAGRLAADAPAADRARWMGSMADALDAAADELIGIAGEETHLGSARLTGELARTTSQLRLLGAAAIDGGYLEATIDHPDGAATPPIPDLRRLLIPFDVVAVYSASNFPFAFSVAGGDTAAALAVGSAVVVKAHPGHERLSARVAELSADALRAADAPDGLLQVVTGFDVGIELVRHPLVDAVAFTGSLTGGRALFDAAAARDRPVPFFGELGSINPVVVTAAAVAERGSALAEGLAGSFTLGLGQFCTKPGLVFVPRGSGFRASVAAAMPADAGTMLTGSIRDGFGTAAGILADHPDVSILAGSLADGVDVSPVLFATTAAALLADPAVLGAECFGPSTLLVEYADDAELRAAIASLDGSLTATLHSGAEEDVAWLVPELTRIAGRVLFSGWPTGVAVAWAQTHGGPYPSTTSQHTSVGPTSMRRFLRPVSYQEAPTRLLPLELRDDNPLGIPQRVDGVLRASGR